MPKLLTILLIGWTVAFFGPFVALWPTPTTDFGLAAWNKVGVFMGWHAAALVLTCACLGVRWTSSDPRIRRLAAIPAVVVGLLALVIGALLVWGSLQRTPSEGVAPPPMPVTAPAPTVTN